MNAKQIIEAWKQVSPGDLIKAKEGLPFKEVGGRVSYETKWHGGNVYTGVTFGQGVVKLTNFYAFSNNRSFKWSDAFPEVIPAFCSFIAKRGHKRIIAHVDKLLKDAPDGYDVASALLQLGFKKSSGSKFSINII